MKSTRLSTIVALVGLTFAAAILPARAAAPLAGTPIGNQAKATYTDDSSVTREVFSNTVITTVTQQAGLLLTADNTKVANPGSQVYFTHTVQNTGNAADSFDLSLGTPSQSWLSFLPGDTVIKIYPDADQNGIPDNYTPITNTGSIAAGGEFHFVVVAYLTSSATVGSAATIGVTATSVYASSQTASNTDTVTAVSGPVLVVSKAVDKTSGLPGTTAIKYTITYTNTGNAAATNFTLTDLLPTGLTYEAGSGRWSVTGATVLTDDAIGVGAVQGTAPNQIDYEYNSGTRTIKAVIGNVGIGQSGYITFMVDVNDATWFTTNAVTLPSVRNNSAAYTFDGIPAGTYNTNVVPFTVLQAAAVTFTGEEITTPAPAGSTVVFHNILTNTGTGVDTFDITYANGDLAAANGFPAGTSFQLYESTGTTPLQDTNGNGTPDTGPLAPGATYTVVIKAILPTNASGTNGGNGFSVTKTATSYVDPTKTAKAVDKLDAISGAGVDLTNNVSLLSNPSAPGHGAGPEGSAVVINDGATNNGSGAGVVPGTTTTFTLYVNNTGPFSDSFNLLADQNTTFGLVNDLPTGWSVVFKLNGVAITNTGAIPSGSSALITAEVTVPAGALASQETGSSYPVYFQAKSPTSGAIDVIHDAVKVAIVRSLTIQTDNVGQTFPGGSVVYTHTLKNTGNVTEGLSANSTIQFGLSETFAGFASTVYADTGVLGTYESTDPIITATGGSGNLPSALAPGATVYLFVKVTAPLGAADGTSNATKLLLTVVTNATGAYNGITITSPLSNVDTTSVTRGDLSIVKEQSKDNGTTWVTTQLTAPPGTVLLYRVTVTNTGSVDATSIVVYDTVPTNTTYKTGSLAVTKDGSALSSAVWAVSPGVAEPADGAVAGTQLAFNVGTLSAAKTAIVVFGVKINQ